MKHIQQILLSSGNLCSEATLVYQIIVQHILLIFGKNPSCTPLFHPARFINFLSFASLHVLFHPAHFFFKLPTLDSLINVLHAYLFFRIISYHHNLISLDISSNLGQTQCKMQLLL